MSGSVVDNQQDRFLQEEEIDLRHYWRVINGYKWRILLLALAVTMLTTLVVFSLTPRYQATATLMIEAEQAKVLSIEEVYGLDSSRSEYFLTQFEILKSQRLAERVIKRLGLAAHPEFDPAQKQSLIALDLKEWLPFLPQEEPLSEEEQQALNFQLVVEQFMEQLTISPIRKTQLVKISFESESAALSAEVANTLAEEFIDSHLEAKLELTQQAATWLNQRLEGLRNKLEESERRLQSFQEAEDLVDVAGVRGLAAQELNEITAQLLETRKKLQQVESIYSQVKARRSDIAALRNLPEVLNHNVIQDIKKAEVEASRKYSELSQRYGPKHPKMIAAQDELRAVRTNLDAEIQNLVGGIENEYRAVRANERSLERALTRAKGSFQKVSRKETRYSELKREVDVNRQLYNAFLTRFKETSETSDFESVNARLTDPAKPPRVAAKPKKKLIVMLAFVVSAMAGVMLAFLTEALHDSIRSVDDVENKLGHRLLALLPLVREAKKAGLDLRAFFDSKNHSFAEAVRTLRTSVVLSHIESPAKVIAVTSSVPGEGKTTTSENLAFAMAQLEKVLLIDADMRRPSIGKNFGLPPYQPGLSNLVAGSNSLAECIHHDDASGLDVMPAGVVPPNPQELLASPAFAKLLEELHGKYDRIVIDTAPALAVSDALLVSRHADSMLYVVKADSTRQKQIVTGLCRLVQVGAKVDGVVLNQLDAATQNYMGSYDGYYGYGYQSEPAVEAPRREVA